ncbi:hypothetical protein DL765_008264 [Monosporascus sp. GIB2]|nr:hypothetical protein DL765_008264 [Monosporascus sp. GIB2]
MGKYGVITSFDDDKSSATFAPDSTHINLRMLLSHTPGHEYDWLNGLLGKLWDIAQRGALDGTYDRAQARYTSRAHAWNRCRNGRHEQVRSEWEPPAMGASDYDIMFGATDCIGGGDVYRSTKGYYTFLSAVLGRDPKLLTSRSHDELFRPQLNKECEQALNDYVALSPAHTNFLGQRIPSSVRKTWHLRNNIFVNFDPLCIHRSKHCMKSSRGKCLKRRRELG